MVSTLDLLIQVTRFDPWPESLHVFCLGQDVLIIMPLCTGVKMGARECNARR